MLYFPHLAYHTWLREKLNSDTPSKDKSPVALPRTNPRLTRSPRIGLTPNGSQQLVRRARTDSSISASTQESDNGNWTGKLDDVALDEIRRQLDVTQERLKDAELRECSWKNKYELWMFQYCILFSATHISDEGRTTLENPIGITPILFPLSLASSCVFILSVVGKEIMRHLLF